MIRVNLGASFEDPPAYWWLADLAAFGVGVILFGGIMFVMAETSSMSLTARHLQADQAEKAFGERLVAYRKDMGQVETQVATIKRSIAGEKYRDILNDKRAVEHTHAVLRRIGSISLTRINMDREGWILTGTAPDHVAVANLTTRLKRLSFFTGIDTLQSKTSGQGQAISFRIRMKGEVP